MTPRTTFLVGFLAIPACFTTNPIFESAGGDDSGDGSTGQPSLTTSSDGEGSGTATSDSTSDADTEPNPTDPTVSDSTSEDPSAGTTDSGPPNRCDAFEFCTSLPEGWLGFSAVTAGGTCSATFPELVDTGFTSVDAPPADCDCECDAPITCADTATLSVLFGADCIDAGGPSWNLVAETQVPTGDILNASGQDRLLLTYDDPDASDCSPHATEEVVEATKLNEQLLCSNPGLLEACEDEYCGDMPDSDRVCVHREGIHACPEGFPTQTVLYRSIEDTRECSECSCTELTGTCGGVSVDIYDGSDSFLYSRDAGDCLALSPSLVESYAVLDPGAFSGSCSPTKSTPTGEASLEAPLTVCCTPV